MKSTCCVSESLLGLVQSNHFHLDQGDNAFISIYEPRHVIPHTVTFDMCRLRRAFAASF